MYLSLCPVMYNGWIGTYFALDTLYCMHFHSKCMVKVSITSNIDYEKKTCFHIEPI